MINMTNQVISYLGHKFLPTSIMSPKAALSHVLEKTGKIAGQLRSCGLLVGVFCGIKDWFKPIKNFIFSK